MVIIVALWIMWKSTLRCNWRKLQCVNDSGLTARSQCCFKLVSPLRWLSQSLQLAGLWNSRLGVIDGSPTALALPDIPVHHQLPQSPHPYTLCWPNHWILVIFTPLSTFVPLSSHFCGSRNSHSLMAGNPNSNPLGLLLPLLKRGQVLLTWIKLQSHVVHTQIFSSNFLGQVAMIRSEIGHMPAEIVARLSIMHHCVHVWFFLGKCRTTVRFAIFFALFLDLNWVRQLFWFYSHAFKWKFEWGMKI